MRVVSYLALVTHVTNALTDEAKNEIVPNIAHVCFCVCNKASLKHTGKELNWVSAASRVECK